MKILVFLNGLSLGGTEKAACRWAAGLRERGHDISVLTLADGPRRGELENAHIPVRVIGAGSGEQGAGNLAAGVAAALREEEPDVIHAHAPGYPHAGDVLGDALKLLPGKIPVVQTNIFGRLNNPHEDQWTDFRLFISWTSGVQAARRSFRKLDENFFRRASVAVYPLDPVDPSPEAQIVAFREKNGVVPDEILFGRLSRPEPNKWTDLALNAFRLALKRAPNIKLLLREPPPLVAAQLRAAPDAGRFIILPATADPEELRLTMSALDVVLHTSVIGESFGYGIAEPMNLGKPVITHSVPWQDQAQIELVRHGECGFITSTLDAMAEAMTRLANNRGLREKMGRDACRHIRALADPNLSIGRLEAVLQAAQAGTNSPFGPGDLDQARMAAAYLDRHQFGHSLREQIALRPFHYRVRFHQFRKKFF